MDLLCGLVGTEFGIGSDRPGLFKLYQMAKYESLQY